MSLVEIGVFNALNINDLGNISNFLKHFFFDLRNKACLKTVFQSKLTIHPQ